MGEGKGKCGGQAGKVRALVMEEEAELWEESNVGAGAGWGAESNGSGGRWSKRGWQSHAGCVGEGRRVVFCGVVGF